MKIVKQSGEVELFNSEKLKHSLLNSGASEDLASDITLHIQKELHDGMGTDKIYKHASFLLKKNSRVLAASYSLRRAVMNLGPSGFPFEKFIAEILKEKGYNTLNNQIVKGSCASHELDVIAYNQNKLIAIEAKFHNSLGIKSDLKTTLYVKARADDIKMVKYNYGGQRYFDENWLVTNTKFSSSAIGYAECTGLRIIGWNYPKSGNLQDMIEDSGLHPITCLESLSQKQKVEILKTGTVLCKRLKENTPAIEFLNLSKDKLNKINKEVSEVCEI